MNLRFIMKRERFELCLTLVLAATCFGLMTIIPWYLGLLISFLLVLVLVRSFILFHDYIHKSSYRQYPEVILMRFFGLLVGTPARRWRRTHLEHHSFTQIPGWDSPGGIPILFQNQYLETSFLGRIAYRMSRSPLLLLLAYPGNLYFNTVHSPKKDFWELFEGILCLVLHAAMHIYAFSLSPMIWLIFVVIPLVFTWAIGTALFYVQHNFPESVPGDEDPLAWTSHLVLHPWAEWWIGYLNHHHAHHIRPGVPFHQLKNFKGKWEQDKVKYITLFDIPSCFKLKLWCNEEKTWLSRF